MFTFVSILIECRLFFLFRLKRGRRKKVYNFRRERFLHFIFELPELFLRFNLCYDFFLFYFFFLMNANKFYKKQMEDDDDSERSFLKRSAFNQYFAISQEMTSFENELFAKFLHEGTFVVNNVLKRNILKLKFMKLPEELKDEIMRKETPQSMSISRLQKTPRNSKQKSRPSQQNGIMSVLSPRKSVASKTKFNIFSTAIQWMASRPGSDNPDLVLAEKLMKASESSMSLKSTTKSLREARSDFKTSQAKCKIRSFLYTLLISFS